MMLHDNARYRHDYKDEYTAAVRECYGANGMNGREIRSTSNRVRILEERLLSDDWYILKKTTFDYRHRDGHWQRQSRETYDRGNGAVLLLFNVDRGTVVLTRQFRFPAYVNGCSDGLLIEACAGLLDGEEPHTCIRREAQEETGFVVRAPRKILEAYMSPGSVTEKLHFFVAEYEPQDRVSQGGGDAAEGEDIEVIEVSLAGALQMITNGAIQDGKTIMLLQYAALAGLEGLRLTGSLK
jgi:nudix-type nucleoside diphosphatase (YffH/AdpP family)